MRKETPLNLTDLPSSMEFYNYMDKQTLTDLSTLITSLNQKKDVLSAVLSLLAENKKQVLALNDETKATIAPILDQIRQLDAEAQAHIQASLTDLETQYEGYLASLKQNSALNRTEIEKLVKAQNDRAFKRLQTVIGGIKMPKNGKDGQNAQPADVVPLVMDLIKLPDYTPDTPEQVRDKLETLEGNDRLDVSAIKGLADYFKVAKKAGKQMLVGGIRFFENLADVSIIVAKKRQDLLAQYNATTNRWENGIAFTVSTTQPSNPQTNDIWVDLN